MCWMHEAQRRSGARREAGKIGRDKRTHDRAGHIGRGKCPEIGDTRSTVPRSTHETIKLRGLCTHDAGTQHNIQVDIWDLLCQNLLTLRPISDHEIIQTRWLGLPLSYGMSRWQTQRGKQHWRNIHDIVLIRTNSELCQWILCSDCGKTNQQHYRSLTNDDSKQQRAHPMTWSSQPGPEQVISHRQ